MLGWRGMGGLVEAKSLREACLALLLPALRARGGAKGCSGGFGGAMAARDTVKRTGFLRGA